jgi:hypothetical protein
MKQPYDLSSHEVPSGMRDLASTRSPLHHYGRSVAYKRTVYAPREDLIYLLHDDLHADGLLTYRGPSSTSQGARQGLDST